MDKWCVIGSRGRAFPSDQQEESERNDEDKMAGGVVPLIHRGIAVMNPEEG